ncbi:hypothetical protein [Floccifex sp.]|uniref:hypothetical protein n=1 Tax=Floccifex sp. TaxID=2815810 RepID=UPI002A75C905|nr:hypothetical protein [Floccifex sp.]MDD7282252.1 hypothetical protein [Erysipelotrichaceae bacterium]MDY2958200.1 hypothetical protein [Floccifex sp.]
MDKIKIKTKLTYFISLGAICVILVMLTYMFFLRTIQVDVMQGLSIEYTGENGNASASAKNEVMDLNQRTQDFYKSVTYVVTPNENLRNGLVIHVQASFDEQLASLYHFEAINTQMDIVVSGLNDRYASLEQIDEKYLDDLLKAADSYLENNAKQIIEANELNEESKLEQSHVVYQCFMKSNNSKASDRVLVMYQMNYLHKDDETILYYTVSIPEVNDGNKVDKQDVFGEKAYLSENEITNLDFAGYIQRIYGGQYTIEQIHQETDSNQQD